MRKLKFHENKLLKKLQRGCDSNQAKHHTMRMLNYVILLQACRRRLSTVLVRLNFAEHLKEAVTYIEQGHIRVGPETVTDPAFLVTRNVEDFVTWVDSYKIKRKLHQYKDKLDDYDLMN